MNNKTVIILGSARADGNTRTIVNALQKEQSIDVIDLSDYQIGYFSYDFSNSDDDFIPLIENVLQYDTLVFATPVYWYSMSAQLKTFFDRFSDLLHARKDLGRQLNGKNMFSVTCSSGDNYKDFLKAPFVETAHYLKMEYKGHLHSWVGEDGIPTKVQQDIVAAQAILKT